MRKEKQEATRQRIAKNLKGIMEKKKIGTYELANGANVSYNHIKRLLEGKSDATVFFLERLAAVLKISVKSLIA